MCQPGQGRSTRTGSSSKRKMLMMFAFKLINALKLSSNQQEYTIGILSDRVSVVEREEYLN